MIYQFTEHSNLPKNSACPVNPLFQLYGKLMAKKNLTRQEKDRIADSLYGTFGAGSSTYKTGGFAAPFHQILTRFIVNIRHCGWQEYYAPDKTSLRKAIGGYGIIEILKGGNGS